MEGEGQEWGLSLPFDVVNTDKLSGANFTLVTALVRQEREYTAVVECSAPHLTFPALPHRTVQAAPSLQWSHHYQQDLLGTMTVIYHSVPLLLLIALATTTLGAHPVKGDASEGESTITGGCISDWRGMKNAYLQHQSSADVENSIFDFNPSDAINYGVLAMFYDVGPPPNTSTSGRRECCQRGSKDCIIHFIYRFTVFGDIHPRLLYSRAGHGFNSFSGYSTNRLCWAPPPLCSHRSEKTLREFSAQVHVNLFLLDVHIQHILYTGTFTYT